MNCSHGVGIWHELSYFLPSAERAAPQPSAPERHSRNTPKLGCMTSNTDAEVRYSEHPAGPAHSRSARPSDSGAYRAVSAHSCQRHSYAHTRSDSRMHKPYTRAVTGAVGVKGLCTAPNFHVICRETAGVRTSYHRVTRERRSASMRGSTGGPGHTTWRGVKSEG